MLKSKQLYFLLLCLLCPSFIYACDLDGIPVRFNEADDIAQQQSDAKKKKEIIDALFGAINDENVQKCFYTLLDNEQAYRHMLMNDTLSNDPQAVELIKQRTKEINSAKDESYYLFIQQFASELNKEHLPLLKLFFNQIDKTIKICRKYTAMKENGLKKQLLYQQCNVELLKLIGEFLSYVEASDKTVLNLTSVEDRLTTIEQDIVQAVAKQNAGN